MIYLTCYICKNNLYHIKQHEYLHSNPDRQDWKKKQKKILLLVFILTKILGIKTNLKTAYWGYEMFMCVQYFYCS